MEIDISSLMAGAVAQRKERAAAPKLTPENEIEVLKGAFASFNKRYIFTPGMLVRQKQGVRYLRDLGDNGLYIVVEMLAMAILSEPSDNTGCPQFRRPVDMIVGVRVLDGEFDLYHVDSRAFEPLEI